MPEPTAEFLLEIGFEEMPASWLSKLLQEFTLTLQEALGSLTPTDVKQGRTPRRLVWSARVLGREADREELVFGPSLKVAKDAAGGWTGAALGFAKKNAVRPEELEQGAKDPAKAADLSLMFRRKIAGRPAAEVLPRAMASTLRSLNFPKRMSWDAWIDDGKGAFPFGRPIRWMVALLDGLAVPFVIREMTDGEPGETRVATGAETRGHRFLPRGAAGQPFGVKSFEDLEASLGRHYVLLDAQARRSKIMSALEPLGEGGVIPDAHGLVEEWVDLVEWPTVVVGIVPAEFRSLPREVLETVLVHHQKYIPVLGGGTVTRFAAVINSDDQTAPAIVRGMERVVVARLRDAAFFWAEDMKRPLEDRIPELAGVTFHQGLGSYKDKAERMAGLVDAMGAEMGILTKPEHEAARRAALLAKADLTTAMVREFPELQGVMGGIYLQAQGDSWTNVAAAVRWHYHPIHLGEDAAPKGAVAGSDSTVFAAVSVADKLDTLAGYFGLGLAPTGSSDPYGLRRAAHGVIRVLFDFWNAETLESRPNLEKLIDTAIAGYEGSLKVVRSDISRALALFFLDRMGYVLVSRGFPAEEVRAVLYPQGEGGGSLDGPQSILALQDPYDCWLRLKALNKVRAEHREDFDSLATAFKRVNNILSKEQAAATVKPELFETDAEQELHATVAAVAATNGGLDARLRSLARLRAPVDHFFDKVLVMAEDPKVRANRLALLHQTLSLFFRIADISKLGGQA
jgi:glycyl-tRNA synthetase beta chain